MICFVPQNVPQAKFYHDTFVKKMLKCFEKLIVSFGISFEIIASLKSQISHK